MEMEQHLPQLIGNLSRWLPCWLLLAAVRAVLHGCVTPAVHRVSETRTTISHGFISTPCIHSVVSEVTRASQDQLFSLLLVL